MVEKIKRTKEIKLRLSNEEHAQLLEKKTNVQLATWIRETCLAEKTNTKRKYKSADPELLKQIGRIGGNLNQIARIANMDLQGGKIDKLRLLAQLATIQDQLNEVLERHDS